MHGFTLTSENISRGYPVSLAMAGVRQTFANLPAVLANLRPNILSQVIYRGLPSLSSYRNGIYFIKIVSASLQSHMILTMSHWSSGLTCLLPPQGSQVQVPRGYLCGTRILLLALSCYNTVAYIWRQILWAIIILNVWNQKDIELVKNPTMCRDYFSSSSHLGYM